MTRLLLLLMLLAPLSSAGAQVGVVTRVKSWESVSEKIPTPVEYNQWWKDAAACANLPVSNLADWQIWSVGMDAFTVESNKWLFTGYTYAKWHSIFLVTVNLMNEDAVKHEMVHALLYDAKLPAVHDSNGPVDKLFAKCGLLKGKWSS